MRFREFLIKQLIENVNKDQTTLTFQAKAINPTLTDRQINDLLTQIEKEENEKYIDKTHAEYVRSTFARKRLKELLGQTKQTQTVKEDPNVRKAKGINAKYYKWILKVNKTMPMSNIDRSVFDYLTAKNVSPETNKSYEEVKRESDDWHREKYEKAKSTEYKLQLDDPKYAHLIEPIRDMYMVQVTEEDEVAEGKNMKHCAGDICTLTGSNAFYSLRDRNNEPHVTIEIDNDKVVQIKAKANESVGLNYSPYVIDWLLKHKDIEIETLDGMQISDKDIERLELNKRLDKDLLLELIVISGDIERVKELINKDPAINKNYIMVLSAEYGHIDIVKLMIEHGANNFNTAMLYATRGGHIEIVKLLIEHGANNFNDTINNAAINGHIDIVKLMIDHGANNFNTAMHQASSFGDIDIVKLMLEKGANNFNESMIDAATNGHIEIVKLMIEQGANHFNKAMRTAAYSGYIDIVKLMIGQGANDFNTAMNYAKANKHTALARFLQQEKDKNNITK